MTQIKDDPSNGEGFMLYDKETNTPTAHIVKRNFIRHERTPDGTINVYYKVKDHVHEDLWREAKISFHENDHNKGALLYLSEWSKNK
ncbi:hypothetical protein [Azospirillum thiophilum]|uniref:hypothetical protein n=1 Tax=Azospirillum thiophilum TaxID=528244 RepID=UPI0011873F14|nr:hypothetical protein [Azospirillum thiophilum]